MTSGVLPERKYMDDESIQWRNGKPDYEAVNEKYLKEKTKNHSIDSLEHLVETVVKSWEMESTHKQRAEDWRTVIPEKFTISANGGPKYTLQENLDIGSYNVLLKDSVLYDAESETIDSALDLFKGAMPGGFAWELTELYSGPPVISFKWRHWGTWEGAYKDREATGETVELFGACVTKVDENLKITDIEVFYDPTPMLVKFTGVDKSKVCPFSK